MADKGLEGRVFQIPLDIHNNYDYDHRSVGDHDHFVFRHGKESIAISLAHPHHEEPVETQESKWTDNAEMRYHPEADRYSYQHTMWDKPHGRSTPPKIDKLFATEGARAHVATALGAVIHHSLKKFGEVPHPDRDLSPHSHALVSRLMGALKDKGADVSSVHVPSMPHNSITKTEGTETAKTRADEVFNSPEDSWYSRNYTEVPHEHIKAGSQLMRQVFAGRHLSRKQFEQPELTFHE